MAIHSLNCGGCVDQVGVCADKCRRLESSSDPAGSNTDLNTGTWYQAVVTGMWYQNASACGEIRAIRVDGKYFYKETQDLPLTGI